LINRGYRPSFCARGPPENAGRRASRGDQPGKQMRTSGKILDDLLRKVLTKLLASTNQITTSRGPAREITGVLLELGRPLARLSRSETRGRPFSSLGEFFWYLSRDNKLDFIRYYIPDYDNETEDGETIYGGYGPRIFRQRCQDQMRNVVTQLQDNSTSRRAVIQIFDAEDIERRHTEIPCTCTLQFLIRRNRLHMLTTMRSNDAYIGLPHDIFCFTMLQEVLARTLGVALGPYSHFVGSLHLYTENQEEARQYLDEGVQATIAMPAMPSGDPWLAIRKVLDAEFRIRRGEEIDADEWGVGPYWADLIRLLQVYAARRSGAKAKIKALKAKMASTTFSPYIDGARPPRRPRPARKTPPPPRQLSLSL
jgi:thymidylate synthase